MKRLFTILLVAGFTLPTLGCFVTTRDRHRHNRGSQASSRNKSCPPSYHMQGGACVHNGKAKGHHKKR